METPRDQLIQWLEAVYTSPQTTQTPSPTDTTNVLPQIFYDYKLRLHRLLLPMLDLGQLEKMSTEQQAAKIEPIINRLAKQEGLLLNQDEYALLVAQIKHEVLGYGPLETLLNNPEITEILVNGCDTIYIERNGKLERIPDRFNNNTHLRRIIDKIISKVNRRIDELSPMVDARLPDGSRVNAIIPPAAIDGPSLSIRRFPVNALTMEELIAKNSMSKEMAEFLSNAVINKKSLLISGGTGSGKTTLLNALSSFIPSSERIITIEDTAELNLQQPHVVRLESRPLNIEGKGEISIRSLVKNSLRMRPDRIILGEVRSDEVLDMLQAMNTGHEGSVTTIHSNSPRDALYRLENLVMMTEVGIPPVALRQQICSAIPFVIQISRLNDGSRKITSIHEVLGLESEKIITKELFAFQNTGTDEAGNIVGRHECLYRLT